MCHFSAASPPGPKPRSSPQPPPSCSPSCRSLPKRHLTRPSLSPPEEGPLLRRKPREVTVPVFPTTPLPRWCGRGPRPRACGVDKRPCPHPGVFPALGTASHAHLPPRPTSPPGRPLLPEPTSCSPRALLRDPGPEVPVPTRDPVLPSQSLSLLGPVTVSCPLPPPDFLPELKVIRLGPPL